MDPLLTLGLFFQSPDLADQLGRWLVWTGIGFLFLAGVARIVMNKRIVRERAEGWLGPVQLEELMWGNAPEIVDVRNPEDFHGPKGHIRGSMNIPFAELSRHLAEIAPKERRAIVVVDEKGEHAWEALQLVKGAGHAWSYALKGGLRAWRRGRLPVATSGPR